MSKRDWGGTVLVACLGTLAGLLHDHTVLVLLLSVAAVASAAVIAWDVMGRRKASKQPQQARVKAGRGIKAGGNVEADGAVEAGDGIEAGGGIRAGAAWPPPLLPPERPGAVLLRAMGQHPDQRKQREHAIRRGHELIGLIFQAELQDETAVSDKAMGLLFYNLAARVEAWARGIGSTEEVPKFGGEPGTDLARLKLFAQTELAGLRALQEQGQAK
jgi:hypothetical protein